MTQHKETLCETCKGEGWVCENHPNEPWNDGSPSCCGGAGSPCKCNKADPPWHFIRQDMEIETPHKEALERLAALEKITRELKSPVLLSVARLSRLIDALKKEIEVNMIADEALQFYAAALEAEGTEGLIEREINGGEFIRIGTTARHALDKIKQVRSKDG